jgi:tetratricopeptide (TPR) repeat protein
LYAQAELELKRALDLDPDHGVAYFYRGECLNQLGRVDEALEMLERSVVLHPHNPRAYFTMGILYDRKHLPQQAAAMYRKAHEVTAA